MRMNEEVKEGGVGGTKSKVFGLKGGGGEG